MFLAEAKKENKFKFWIYNTSNDYCIKIDDNTPVRLTEVIQPLCWLIFLSDKEKEEVQEFAKSKNYWLK